MAEEIGKLAVGISLDDSAFNSSISGINRSLKVLGGELAAIKGKGSEWGNSVEGLSQKQGALGRTLGVQEAKVRQLRAAYEASATETGQYSEKTQRLAQQLNSAVGAYNRTENELNQVNTALQRQQQETAQTETKWQSLQRTMAAAGTKMQGVGSQMQSVGQSMMLGITAPLAAIGVSSVKTAADFESQMSRVGAIAGATESDMKALSDSALELGASTSKSASEVAKGQESLAALGFTTQDILSAMPAVISAAEASGADMAQTAEVVASSLNIWGMKASEAGRVSDILAETANRTAADITDMQYALKYAGPPAAALGVSIEETSAAIGLMTNAGMKGEQAGTTLRGGLLALLKPSEETGKMMQTLGINITDAQGDFVGLSGLVDNLSSSFKGMTETQKLAALSQLVGTEAASGFLTLMKAGPTEIDKMTNSLKNSGGASAEAAAKMKDNLKGTLDELAGSFETIQISIGTALTPAIAALAGILQQAANWFNNLSPAGQQLAVVFGAIAAAIPIVITVIGVLLGIVGSAITAITAMGGAAAIGGALLAAITSPVTIVIAALVALGAAFAVLYAKNETFRNAVTTAWNSIKAAAMSVFNFLAPYVMSALSAVNSFVQSKLTELKSFWTSNGASIVQAVTNIWNFIKNVISVGMAVITPIVKVGFMLVKSIIQSTWEAIKNIISGALKVIQGVVQVFSGIFTGNFKQVWSGIKTIFMGALQAIWGVVNLYLLGKLLGPLRGFASAGKSVITGAWNAIKSVFTSTLATVKNLVTTGFSAVKNVMTTMMNGAKSVVTAAWSALKSSVSSAIGSIRSSVSSGFSTVKSVISNAMSAVRSVVTSTWSAVKSAVSSAVSAVKSAVSNGFNALKSVVSQAMSNVVSAIRNGWNNAVSFLKGINLSSIGRNIIQGLVNGIKGAAGFISDAVSAITDKIPAIIKKKMGIHSPSRVTTKLGEHTGQGMANGISNKAREAEKQATSMAQKVTNAIKNAEVKFDTKKINANQYIAALKKIDAQHKLTADQSRKVQKEIYSAQQSAASNSKKSAAASQKKVAELIKNAEIKFDTKKIGAATYIATLKRIDAAHNLTADQTRKVQKEIYAAQKTMTDAQKKQAAEAQKFYTDLDKINDTYVAKVKDVAKKLAETEKKLTEDYKKEYDTRKKELSSFAGVFETITPKPVDGASLVTGMKSQVKTLQSYTKSIAALQGKGLSKKLLDELQAQGPDAASELAALAGLNDAQLAEYQRLYDKKNKLAKAQTDKEMADEKAALQKRIIEERAKAAKTVNAYKSEWIKKIDELKKSTLVKVGQLSPGMKNAGKDAIRGMIDGMNAMSGPLERAAEKLAKIVADSTKNKLKIKSPSRVFKNEVGKMIPAGIIGGVESGAGALRRTMQTMSQSLLKNANVPDYGQLIGRVASPQTTMQNARVIATQTGSQVQQQGDHYVTVEIPLNLNGREVARVVQPHINTKQQSQTARKSYQKGVR